MDSSEPRRKRKRLLRQSTATAISPLLTVRSFLLCICFLLFVYLLSFKIPIAPSSFRPVLVVSSFSLLSSSSSNGVESLPGVDRFLLPRIEGRVLFPDHILLLVRKNGLPVHEKLECVYPSRESQISAHVLSSDDYDQSRVIFRCPLPPGNSSAAAASLRKVGGKPVVKGRRNQTAVVASWDSVVYAAALDGDSAVVFVKGLNLRRDRESSPRWFSCHFWLGKKMKKEEDRQRVEVLQTRAVTAAQEVVRCQLPASIKDSPEEALGGRVTVGTMMTAPRGSRRVEEGRRFLFPSVAEVSRVESGGGGKKHGLCACTMVWNQAPALREWITYHAWLGVERWFIYDNNSDDAIEDVIYDPEMRNFNVTRHVWPWIKTQEAGFSHCALRAKSECDWVAFMDVDEFFYLPYSSPHYQFRKPGYASKNALRDLVRNVSLSSPGTLGEIRTACHSYGPSGLDRPPAQGVTVGYTCRVKSPERHKSIVRPDAVDPTLLNVVHHFRLKKGFRFMDMPQGTAVINHYKYQVWEVFRAKFFRRVATYVADWTENQNEGSRDRAPGLGTEAIEPPNWRLQFCEVWDTGLRDFVLANFADSSTGFLPWETSPQYEQ
ncbi:hypothetical protein DM860_006896 [Cuscuta australis]|uniref:Glycosyltransferase family 92 protein n=1 Tax=Cuscuta australis TaxID=267555 RepID=A0A328E5C9_9ASTE|nr:hypothetical protein DM860_006896 [Cuscuta australis]